MARRKAEDISELTRTFHQHGEEALKRYMLRLLEEAFGNVSEAARLADVTRSFFWHWLRRMKMNAVPTDIRNRVREEFRMPDLEEFDETAA